MSYISTLSSASGATPTRVPTLHDQHQKLRSQERQQSTNKASSGLPGDQPSDTPTAQEAALIPSPRFVNRRVGYGGTQRPALLGGLHETGSQAHQQTRSSINQTVSDSTREASDVERPIDSQLGRAPIATTGIPTMPPSSSPRQRIAGFVSSYETPPSRPNQSAPVGSQKHGSQLSAPQQRMQAQPQTPINIQAAPRLSKALPRLINQQQANKSAAGLQSGGERLPTTGFLLADSGHGSPSARRLADQSDHTHRDSPQQSATTATDVNAPNRGMILGVRSPIGQAELDRFASNHRHHFQAAGDQLEGQEQQLKPLKQQQEVLGCSRACQPHNLLTSPPSLMRQQEIDRDEVGEQTSTTRSATHYLPRYGVSKIPHQVNGNETPNDGSKYNRYYQSRSSSKKESSDDKSNNNIVNSKYLTFSKDQATSHFKSLKEELSTTLSAQSNQNGQTNKTETQVRGPEESGLSESLQSQPAQHLSSQFERLIHQRETSPPVQPKPLDRTSILKQSQQQLQLNCRKDDHRRESHLQAQQRQQQQQQQQSRDNLSHPVNDDCRHLDNLSSVGAANSWSRQQPICEAFIMTGQSMLKLSCNESENNSNSKSKTTSTSLSSSSNVVDSGDSNANRSSQTSNNNNNNINNNNNSSADNIEHAHRDATTREPPAEPQPRQRQLSSYSSQRGKSLSLSKLNESAPGPAGRDHLLGPTGGLGFADKESSRPLNQREARAQQLGAGPHERTLVAPGSLTKSPAMDDEKTRLVLQPNTSVAVDEVQTRSTVGNPIGAAMDQPHRHPRDLETSVSNEHEEGYGPADQRNDSSSCHERESARRLAKRLYNLSGFKKSDVCHHLSKSNPFSQMVIEEYLNLFDFRTMKLDASLRKFLSKLQLTGETQERERLLAQFSKRYYDCNKEKFPNADTVQTLVCALILLNTDLHGVHGDRKRKSKRTKLSLGAFIDGLNSSLASLPTAPPLSSGNSLNSDKLAVGGGNNNLATAYTFPRHLLVDLYESIKKRPLKYVEEKCDMTSFEAELDKIYGQHQMSNGSCRSNTLPTRRFAPGSNAPSSTLSASSRRQLKYGLDRMNGTNCFDDPETAIEFKSGLCYRKRVSEAQGKPTPKGRRSWRRAQFILKDLRLIMRYDRVKELVSNKENESQQDGGGKQATDCASQQKQQFSPKMRAKLLAQDMKNMIRVNHAFAKRSTSYTKRDYVFHLVLSDQSEYLIQADDEQEMLSWVDTINFASACLSSPALPSAVSNSKRGQQLYHLRPILPANYTKLSYWEQLIDHEERLQRLKTELEDHLNEAPRTRNANKRFKTEFIDKIAYLKQEIERYSVYVDLMRKKSNSPEAIVLSKHPQIASLTPSEEMIKTLPSVVPAELAEDKLIESER